MTKDYEIKKSDLIKGKRWLVFKRINRNFSMYIYGAMTKKECQQWIDKNAKKN